MRSVVFFIVWAIFLANCFVNFYWHNISAGLGWFVAFINSVGIYRLLPDNED